MLTTNLVPSLLAVSAGDVLGWLLWGVAAIAGLVVLFYLAIPWLVYATARINSGDVFEEIDVDQVRPEAHEYFARIGDGLVAIGYQPWLTLQLRGLVKSDNGGFAHSMVYANRRERTMALVSVLIQPRADGDQHVLLQTEFACENEEGHEFNATNAAGVAQEVRDPKVTTVQARGLDDIRRLHAIHRALCRGERLRELPGENELIAVLNEQNRARLKRREVAGILYKDTDGVTYRPTAWGAYVLTARHLPPFTWLYWAKQRRLVTRLELEAGRTGASHA